MTPTSPPTENHTAARLATVALAILSLVSFAGVGAARAHEPAPGAAAPRADPFDQLIGVWSGEGTLLGRPAGFEMAWSAGTAPGVYRLSFSNGFTDPAAPAGSAIQPVLSAEALYRLGPDGDVQGTWFDTRGVRIDLEGEASATELRILWTAPTETGVTLYRVMADGVEVIDSVQVPDGWREFGRARYTRRDPR